MITKAIIKRLNTLEDNHFIVYVPFFQKANDTESSATMPATLIYTPGIVNTLHVGDVVYVGFEDNSSNKPIILGKLYTGSEGKDTITTTLTSRTLEITEKSKLPINTCIGDLNLTDIHKKLNYLSENNSYDSKNIIYSNRFSTAVNVKEELDRIEEKLIELEGRIR